MAVWGLKLVIVTGCHVRTRLGHMLENVGRDGPILLLGTHSDMSDVVAALEAGADEYVTEPDGETVRRGDRDLGLTATEYRLLHELAHAPGGILRRRALLDRVWDGNVQGSRRVLDVHIRRQRA